MSKTNKIFKEDDNNPEIQSIKKAIKDTKNLRMYQRYMVILYHLQGYFNNQISELLCLCQSTVGTYIKKYNEFGIDGLVVGHGPGAPHLLSDEQEKILVEIITTKTPDEVGFNHNKNWTIAMIKQWVFNTFNVTFSPSGMADVLYRLNLSYTRPTYVMAKADPVKQEDYKKEFEVLKKID
jgi:transposase